MDNAGYNGYRNYETWLVMLHITNDIEICRGLEAEAARLIKEMGIREAKYTLAKQIDEMIDNMVEDVIEEIRSDNDYQMTFTENTITIEHINRKFRKFLMMDLIRHEARNIDIYEIADQFIDNML